MAFKKLEETYGPIVGLKLGRQKIVTISTCDFVKQALLQDEFNGRPESFLFKIRAFGKKKGLIYVVIIYKFVTDLLNSSSKSFY